MNTITQTCFRTRCGTLFSGLRLGFVLAFMYSAGFLLYAVVRSSWHIAATLSLAEGLLGTLVANAFALILSMMQRCNAL